MNCPKCNAPIRPGAKFCTSCGERIVLEEASEASEGRADAAGKKKTDDKDSDFRSVDGRIYWNIQPGQVARVIDEAEFDSYGNIKGIIVQEGTTAFIRANGRVIADISGGYYDLSGDTSSAGGLFRAGWNFIVNLFWRQGHGKDAGPEENLHEQQQKAILECARKGEAFSVVLILNKSFPMLIGARQQNPDDYINYVPMVVHTAKMDLQAGLNAYFRISKPEKFIVHYLTGRSVLNTTHIVDEISDAVRTAVEKVLYDADLKEERVPEELAVRIKDAVNESAEELFLGLSVVRIVEITVSNEDLARFRALSRELYLSEEELDYLRRTNDFKNRLASVQADEVMSELEIRKRLDEINKDGLLHDAELERFAVFLENEQAVRLAQNEDERETALAEIEKTGLIREDEIDEIRQRTASGKWQRSMAFNMMQLKDGIEFERVRMEGEMDKAVLVVKKELAAAGLKDDYSDSRFYKELDKRRAVSQAAIEEEKARRDLDYEDMKREHDLQKEDSDAQFQQFAQMQRLAEESRENERRHQAEMERLKWENAKDLSDEKVWALNGGDAAKVYAETRYNAALERETNERLEAQRREMDSRLDAERAARDAEHRENQNMMFQLMNNMLNMTGGIYAQKSEEKERRAQEKMEEKDRQLQEKEDRILRQEGRMDTAYDRALDYTTRNNVARRDVSCPDCGARIAPGEQFCPDCGAEIRKG